MDEQNVGVGQATISLEEAEAELSESPTGAMPPHWRVLPLGEVASVLMGQSPPGETYNQARIGKPLINGPAEYGPEYPTPVQWTTKPERVCKAEDILFCVRGNTTGRMNIADQEYCIGRGVAAIHGTEGVTETGFIRYFLEFRRPLIYRIAAAGGSTFPNFSGAQLKGMAIPLPPLTEQRVIAHTLRTVQEAIQTRRREADLERERKVALMQHLFAYGTRGEPTMQTELGEMPESWQVVALREMAQCLDSKRVPVNQSERNTRPGNIPYYGASGLAGWIDGYLFDEPLLLVAEDGENLASRKLPIAYSIHGKSWVNNHAHVLRVTKADQVFIEYFFNSIDLAPYLGGATRPKLNQAQLMEIRIPAPRPEEQREIANILSATDTKITTLEQETTLLEELFRALLEELMTGQLSTVFLVEGEVVHE